MWAIAAFFACGVGVLLWNAVFGDAIDQEALAEIADTLLPRRN